MTTSMISHGNTDWQLNDDDKKEENSVAYYLHIRVESMLIRYKFYPTLYKTDMN